MKQLLSILCLLILVSCTEQEPTVYKGPFLIIEEVTYDQETNKPITGKVERYLETGQLSFRENFIDGKPDGLQEGFYEDGQLHIRGYWKEGRPDGLKETFSKEGVLTTREYWKEGKLDGTREVFLTGQLTEKTNFVNDLKELTEKYGYEQEGGEEVRLLVMRIEYQKGETLKISNYDYEGVKLKEVRHRNKNHKLLFTSYYSYFPNGELKDLSSIDPQKKYLGPQEEYFENGQLKMKVTFGPKGYEGLLEEYTEKGSTLSLSNWKEGKPHGVWKEYYENGNLSEVYNLKNGLRHGIYEHYDENGKLEGSRNYKDDTPQYPYKEYEYDKKGTLIREWKDGELVE